MYVLLVSLSKGGTEFNPILSLQHVLKQYFQSCNKWTDHINLPKQVVCSNSQILYSMANPEFRLPGVQYLQSLLKDTDCCFSSGEI